MMNYYKAAQRDVALLAELNRQLIQDEGHRNQMTLPQLEQRMSGWLAGEYEAVLFEQDDHVVAYALYKLENEYIYLRQFFVCRGQRRQGVGRQAIYLLTSKIWPAHRRIRIEVLVNNEVGRHFWRSVGFLEYAVTMELERSA